MTSPYPIFHCGRNVSGNSVGTSCNKIRFQPWLIMLVMCCATVVPLSAQEMIAHLTCTIVNDQTDSSAPSDTLTRESRRTKRLLGTARKLITLREGQPLDTLALQESLDALSVCGLFERVDLQRSPGSLVFRLIPARYIRDIRFTGEYPLFEEDLEKALTIYPGALFRRDEMDIQDSLLIAFYRREGFVAPSAKVSVRENRQRRQRNLIVDVNIIPGVYYRLQSVTITGNRHLSDTEIKLRMKAYLGSLLPGSAGRFIESVYRKDLKTLSEYYRLQKFADITIHDTLITDPFTRTVQAVLNIDEGDRYSVHLPSKRCRCGVNAAELRKAIALFKYGNRNNLGVRRSVQALTRKFKEAGCVDTRVNAIDTTIQHRRYTERSIRFTVEHGIRTVVSSIKFHGARSFSENVLRAQMVHTDKGNEKKRVYIPEKLQEDLFALKALYRSNGFLKTTITSSIKEYRQGIKITIDIQEGVRTVIENVAIDTSLFSDKILRKAVRVVKGAPFLPDQLKRDAYSLQSLVSERGYPHANVVPVVTMSADSSSVEIIFTIDEGPQVVLGDIHYVGAFRTRRRVFNRELKSKEGSPFSLRDIIHCQKELRDIGLFNTVRFRTIGLAEKRDTVHLFVEVAEKKPYYGAFGAGYQSDKAWYLNAKLGDRNIRGWGNDAWVKGEVSGTGFRAETGLLDPRFFGSRLSALIKLYHEQTSELNQDWTSRVFGISNGFTMPIGQLITTGLGTSYERRRLSYPNGATDALTSDDRRERDVVTMTPSFTLDNRDSFTRPRKGLYVSASVDLSKSFGNSLDNFLKAQFEARHFITLLPRLTFAGVIRSGYVRSYGGGPAIPPKDRLFYLGGTGDVRGFAENLIHHTDSSGGTASLSASIEARMELNWNFELTVFTDAGRLENDFSHFARAQFRQSVGGGIRYLTPIGPIGLLYGIKADPLPGEAPGAWHFSLGYTF